jgi:dephospho-CoA kinase
MMRILVVTGGIGSGKSKVCAILEEVYGFPVYNADSKVKGLYESDPEVLDSIEEALGQSFRTEDGKFSPSLLAGRIFSDEEDLVKVEQLVFPALVRDFKAWQAKAGNHDFIVFESATILEKEHFKGFGDVVMLVDAPIRLRLERACRRDSSSEDKVLARMSKQKLMNEFSEGIALPEVDVVIANTGDVEELKVKVTECIDTLLDRNIDNN